MLISHGGRVTLSDSVILQNCVFSIGECVVARSAPRCPGLLFSFSPGMC